jgi:SulP family sulfate permease
MIDRKEITRILHGAPGDVFIMATTFGATLLLPLQFAVLTGILSSFAVYILRTSLPRVVSVLPDDNFKHLIHRPDKPDCPQMAIFKILGDLYFGAVSNVEKVIHDHLVLNPDQRFLLVSMESVNHCDISGIHTLESILRTCRDRGGDLFFQRVQEPVLQIMQATGFADQLGKDNFLSEDHAISKIFHHILDPAICIYECEERVFLECQNLPKQIIAAEQIPLHTEIPTGKVNEILPNQLWEDLHGDKPPLIVDVREPREYQRGHIPQAKLIPLNQLLTQEIDLPREQSIVTVCRSGRRGSRAAFALSTKGYTTHVLKGGMLGWENAGLLEAIE